MRLIGAFLRLIRYPNLIFIAVTQILFFYCIIVPGVYPEGVPFYNDGALFFLLVLSSVFIAAGGYVINDYFDLNIDLVNKPDRLVIEKLIRRRWAIIWHWFFSTGGVVAGFFISFLTRNWVIGFANLGCVILLWFYSTTFKKKLLVGNVIISVLTAWVVMAVFFFMYRRFFIPLPGWAEIVNHDPHTLRRLMRFAFLYSGFAFIISLVREVVKDIEDMEGDEKYGCRTLPIVWGVPAAKIFAAVWLVVIIAMLVIVQFYVLQMGWWWSALFCILLIILPLLYVLRKLYTAQVPADYHRLSSLIKWAMLTGILSMIFFKFYG
jgi:4-hydroxybenzoate polyprenyltransferase